MFWSALMPYTLNYALALLVGGVLAVWRAPRLVDALLVGLAFGMALAHLEYVLLTGQLGRYWQFAFGGYEWHGAFVGGLAGLGLVCRVRGDDAPFDALTPAVPLLGLAGWRACAQAGCAYGHEVTTLADYPRWLVAEAPDIFGIVAPRYDTQTFGVLLMALLLAFVGVLFIRGWLTRRRFWLVGALFCATMFGLGFLRADFSPQLGPLRADQWLDLVLLALCLLMFIGVPYRENENRPRPDIPQAR